MKLLLGYLTLFFSFILSITGAVAQQTSDPLNPEPTKNQKEIGIYFGLGSNNLNGIFSTLCCPYDDAKAFGFNIGVLYESDIELNLHWGIDAEFNSGGINGSYQKYELKDFPTNTPGEFETLKILTRHRAEISIAEFNGIPYIKWRPFDFMFLKFGISAGYILSARVKDYEELLQKTAKLSNGEIVNIRFIKDGDTSSIQVVEEGDIPEIRQFQIGVQPEIGFIIPFADNGYLKPSFRYNYPLTTISGRGENFRIPSFRFILEFDIAIEKRTTYW